MTKKGEAIYKEEYNVFLVETEKGIYRVETYFQIKREATPSPKETRYKTKVKEVKCEKIMKRKK